MLGRKVDEVIHSLVPKYYTNDNRKLRGQPVQALQQRFQAFAAEPASDAHNASELGSVAATGDGAGGQTEVKVQERQQAHGAE